MDMGHLSKTGLSEHRLAVSVTLLAFLLSPIGVADAEGLASRMAKLNKDLAKRPAQAIIVPTDHAASPPPDAAPVDFASTTAVTAPTQNPAALPTQTPESAAAAAAATLPITEDATAIGTHVDGEDAHGQVVGATASETVETLPRPQNLQPGLYKVALASSEEGLALASLSKQFGALASASEIATFPDVIRHVDVSEEVLDLKPFALAGGPLVWMPARSEYVGSLMIGVAVLGDRRRRKLSTPLTFQIVDGGVTDIDSVTLSETSPPLKRLPIRTAAFREEFIVRVASSFAPEGIPVTFNMSPTLFVKTDRRTLQGYGLETTRLHVYTMGLSHAKGKRVDIETNPSAHVANTKLVLDDSGAAETTLRSDATGVITLTASAVGMVDASREIRFVPPWRTLTSSLLGGLVGGVVRLTPTLNKEGRLVRTALALMTAVLVGLLVFGLTIVGVNVLPVDFVVRVGDIFVFVVSALGAFAGTAALRQFSLP